MGCRRGDVQVRMAEVGLAREGRRETLSEPPWRELAHLGPVLFLLPCSGAGGQHKGAMRRPAGAGAARAAGVLTHGELASSADGGTQPQPSHLQSRSQGPRSVCSRHIFPKDFKEAAYLPLYLFPTMGIFFFFFFKDSMKGKK